MQEGLLEDVVRKPANSALRSQYALSLYVWAKNQLSLGTKRLTLKQLRTVLGLDSVKDADGKVIRKAPLTDLGEPAPKSVGYGHQGHKCQD